MTTMRRLSTEPTASKFISIGAAQSALSLMCGTRRQDAQRWARPPAEDHGEAQMKATLGIEANFY